MSKKLRKKKGTKSTITRKATEIFVKNAAIVQLNANPLELFELDTMKINRGSNGQYKDMIMNRRHRWSVGLLLFTTESNGKRKMILNQLNFGSANTYEVLCDELISCHREMLAEYDSKLTIESLGVIATPNYKYEFDTIHNDIDSIFELMGCYEQTINKMLTED